MADQEFDCGKCMGKCITGIFFKFPLTIFSWVMIGIGAMAMSKELFDCPSARYLPVILITGGSVLSTLLGMRDLIIKLCSKKMNERECNVGGKAMKCGVSLFYDCCFINLAILWAVISCIYVANNVADSPFNYWKNVWGDSFSEVAATIEGPDAANAAETGNQGVFICSNDVYNMTIVSLILAWIIIPLALVFLVLGRLCCNIVCCKVCQDSNEGTVHA